MKTLLAAIVFAFRMLALKVVFSTKSYKLVRLYDVFEAQLLNRYAAKDYQVIYISNGSRGTELVVQSAEYGNDIVASVVAAAQCMGYHVEVTTKRVKLLNGKYYLSTTI